MSKLRVDRRRLQLLTLGTTALAVIAVSAGAMSLALFTDDAEVTDNQFTTGTIVLTATPASALFNVTALMPGDSADGQLTVANGGSADLRYAMTTSATNADGKDLRDSVSLQIRKKATGTCSADFTGSVVLAATALSSAAFGDPAQGAQTGDRELAGSANEILCFRASLPAGTDNDSQGAATTATFTFHGEQTSNNP
jgi:predicted ribosomally synthesized peptide with SipW-like signal peptide